MIKLLVHYFDIVFPVNLRPLTYKCPEHLSGQARPGMIVSAPLRNRTAKGIILEATASPPAGPIKEFSSIDGDFPVLGKGMLKLLRWMSDYYLASEGSVLQQIAPKELFVRVKARKTAKKGEGPRFSLLDVPPEEVALIRESAAEKRYRTFLVHAPSTSYEYSFISNLLQAALSNVIVIFPEVSQAETFYSAASGFLEDRACLLHGGISRGKRSESLAGIISGKHDIVIGTRAALFAPIKNVSLIAVVHEDSGSYKLEEGLRYNIRDVAVMRGFLEKCTVLLSSVTPSIESSFNALTQKYIPLKPAVQVRRPRVTIIDMRYARKVRPGISKEVFDAARNKLKAKKKIMFVVNRRGYSTLLLCADCGHEERCDNCDIPLVMHRDEKALKCHYCGKARAVPERCGRCGGLHIELRGSGTQRVQEEIEELFGMESLRFDSDGVKKKSEVRKLLGSLSRDSSNIIIGTKMMTKRIGAAEKFSLAAVLNTDAYLNFPDFRASEKAYRELSTVIDLAEPGGDVLVQTRLPQNSLFRHLKKGDYDAFVKEELAARKELAYPPYSKLMEITVSGNSRLGDAFFAKIRDVGKGIEILGPVASKNKKRKDEFSVFLKSGSRKALNDAARSVLHMYEGVKGLKIAVDVDPA
ncbi:MAG: primosomal protein N' [Thermodesulfovibrionales bacterium]